MVAETAKRLLDALEAARRIREFVGGRSFDHFAQSVLLRSAGERQFEIVGEALGKACSMEPQLVESIVELPRIVGLRNRLIHGYDSVDDEIIWDIVQTKITPLIEQLEKCLAKEGYLS
jgi:uncharacterized protein with HEPN domain